MTGETTGRHGRALAVVWIVAALYLLPFVQRGWIPSDDGLLAHSAERVLAGELPHRDFGDMYTGGQAFIHALALRVLGPRLTSLRWLLYAATLLALPLIYRVASRVAPPAAAAAVTAACVVWTVPNYFTAMPSWYNLYLTLAALFALLRHVESGRRRWLLVAGLATGGSFLVKSSALLLIAAVFLFLVYREQQLSADEDDVSRGVAWPLFTTAGVVLFLVVLVRFVAMMPAPAEVLNFVGPSLCLCAVPVAGAWQRPGGGFRHRLKRLTGLTWPYLVGLALPCLVFVLPYLARGGADVLLRANVFFPTKRLAFTYYALPRVETAVFVLPMLALLLWPIWRPCAPRVERRLLLPLVLGLVTVVALGTNLVVYQSVWYSVRPLPLAVSLAASLLLLRRSPLTGVERQSLFLVVALTAVVSVSQFPFARGIYFCYVAPLVILALLYLVRAQRGAPQRLHLAMLAFYVVFAALWLNLSWVEALETRFDRRVFDTPLALERGGLRVSAEEAATYGTVIEEVRRHSPAGAFIYASPDCPEIYFLADRRNPTPSFYDYFEDDFGTPERTARLLRMLDEYSIDVVVLNWRPNFSALPEDFVQAVFKRFPNQVAAYPRFTVHWREHDDGAGGDLGQGHGRKGGDAWAHRQRAW